jgi:hypothetical protein
MAFSSTQMKRRAAACCFAMASLWSGSALAAVHDLSATMSGGQVVPPNAATATGTCSATIDDATGVATVTGSFSGLTSAAIHVSLHGLAGRGSTAPVLIPATTFSMATSGTFSMSATLPTSDIAGVIGGQAYCEADDPAFPQGEIRGQLLSGALAPAFSPSSLALIVAALAVGALGMGRRRATAS